MIETIALSFAAVVFAVLYGLEVVNWFRLIRCRKPGVPFSIWLIYQPNMLTDEGARALWRYWGFGLAAFAWAALWFALWAALWAPPARG